MSGSTNAAVSDLGCKNRTRRVEEAKIAEKCTSNRSFCTIFDLKILAPEEKIGSFLYIFQTLTQISKKKSVKILEIESIACIVQYIY
jgi:hypothetical protein